MFFLEDPNFCFKMNLLSCNSCNKKDPRSVHVTRSMKSSESTGLEDMRDSDVRD